MLNPRLAFFLRFAAASALLFVVWPGVSQAFAVVASGIGSGIRESFGGVSITLTGEKDSYELIPALALMIASMGHSAGRKTAYAGVLIGGFAVLMSVAVAADLITSAANDEALGTLFFIMLNIVFPLGVVITFVGRHPSSLWEPGPVEGGNPISRCPLCRAQTGGLEIHIREAHGSAALRDPRVRRALNLTRRV